MIAVFVISLMKSPEAITKTLNGLSLDVRSYSVLIHILLLVVIGVGLFFIKWRDFLFTIYIALLSVSAMVVLVKYLIVPNILIFTMIFGAILSLTCSRTGFRL